VICDPMIRPLKNILWMNANPELPHLAKLPVPPILPVADFGMYPPRVAAWTKYSAVHLAFLADFGDSSQSTH
jgi:hypothetical protein